MTNTTPPPTADDTPPAGAEQQPPAGTPDPQQTPEAPAANAQTPEITPEIQKLIDEAAAKASRDANREAIAAKKRAKELEDAEQKRKDAELSETERLQKERDEAIKAAEDAKAAATAATIRTALERAAIAAGFADPTDALSLADAITLDDDGQPVGVTEAVAGLLAAKPHYAKGPGTPGLDASNGGRKPAPDLTPEQQTDQLYAHRKPVNVWDWKPAA